jgi:hypothetical protein
MKKVKKDSNLTESAKKSEPNRSAQETTDFRSLLGIGIKVPMNPDPKFTTEDQIWEEDVD